MLDNIAHEAHLSTRQQDAMRALAGQVEALNAAMRDAVGAGVSVEMRRGARFHCGSGHWGDEMMPVIVKAS